MAIPIHYFANNYTPGATISITIAIFASGILFLDILFIILFIIIIKKK